MTDNRKAIMAGVNGIEIKVGQVWRCRDGSTRQVTRYDSTDTQYPWLAGGHWYNNAGVGDFKGIDLIELVKDENGFTTWRGGKCPVSGDTLVECRLRSGTVITDQAKTLYWEAQGENETLRMGYAAARLEIESLQARIKTMAEEHADELMVAHLDGRMCGHSTEPEGAQQPGVATWTPLPGTLPEPGKPVLLDIGMEYPIRAMWAAKHALEVGMEDDSGFGEYDEATDTYYCPEGWYEWNEHEETHWAVDETPVAWCELPSNGGAPHRQAPAQAAPVCGSPADLPPLPDPDLRDVGTKPEDIKNFLRGYATEYAKAALASSAPADSVLEDAAQVEIDLFNDLNRIYGNTLTAYAKEMCRLGYRKTNAARKQGETNEH